MDLVSIIVPVYKTDQYLARCVNSILNQSYSNIEIFLWMMGRQMIVQDYVINLKKNIQM